MEQGGEASNAAPAAEGMGMAMARIAGEKETAFNTKDELLKALDEADKECKADRTLLRKFRYSEKVVEGNVDRFLLYLLSKYGTIRVGSQVVISKDILEKQGKERMNQGTALAKIADVEGGGSARVQQNQGSYKTIGESFRADYLAYWNVGGLTQFRKYLGWSGWWDTNAGYLSVHTYYMKQNASGTGSHVQYDEWDWWNNDDYVSVRDAYGNWDWGIQSYHYVKHAGYTWKLKTSTNVRFPIEWSSYGQGTWRNESGVFIN